MPPDGSGGALDLHPLTRCLLVPVVVLGAIDLPRLAILLAVDLGALLRRQFAAVGSPVRANLVVDARLISFQVGRFSRRQLAALNAVGDAGARVKIVA